MRSPITLYLRVRSACGSWIYVKPHKTVNHKLRPLYGVVGGVPRHCPEGSYVLRYNVGGKRVWEMAGADPELATTAFNRKTIELQAGQHGMALVADVPPVETPEPTPEPKVPGRPIAGAVEEYLLETKNGKSKKTYAAYQKTLSLFGQCCKKVDLEHIDRKDMLGFVEFLKAKGSAPRTVRNRVDFFQIFLHHFGLPSLLKDKDLPKFTEKTVRAYSPIDLGKMFGHADLEEPDRLNFLLCTGTREQEAQYACWSDLDLDAKTYTITEHLDLGYKPKDAEEGTIPISRCGPLRSDTTLEVGAKRCRSTSMWNCKPVKTFASYEYSAEPRRRTSPALLLAQGRCESRMMLDCVRSAAAR